MNKNKKNTWYSIIIIIVVVGLISLIPYSIKEKYKEDIIVNKKEEFKIGNITYKIPKDFNYNYSNDDTYKNYVYDNVNIYCKINIEVYTDKYETYKTAEDYLKRNTYINLLETVEMSNNEEWFTVDIRRNNENEINKISAIKKGDEIYILEYRFNDYSNGEDANKPEYKKCITAYDYVFESITFTK